MIISNKEQVKRYRISTALFRAFESAPTLRAMKCSPNARYQKQFRKVQNALEEFIMRVPIDVLKELSKKFDKLCIEAYVICPDAIITHPSDVSCLSLLPGALRLSKKKLLGLVAHEMAHLYMGVQKSKMTKYHEPEHEDNADILAAEWGFNEVFLLSPFPVVESNRKYWPSN